MGGSWSSNQVDDVTNSIVDIVSVSASSVLQSGTCQNILNFDDCTFTDSKIEQGCEVSGVFKAIQNTSSNIDVESSLDELIKQKSEAIAQAVGFSIAGSENITKAVTNLVTSIKQTISQSCNQSVVGGNVIKCKGSTFIRSSILQTSINTIVGSCLQTSDSVIHAKQELKKVLDQYSHSEVKDNLTGIILGLILIMLAPILLPMLGAGSIINSLKSNVFGKALLMLLAIGVFQLLVWVDCKFSGFFCDKNNSKPFKDKMVIFEMILVICILIYVFITLFRQKKIK